MSDAYHYRGLIIEVDLPILRLTIEGREVRDVRREEVDGLFVSSELPGVQTETLFQLAQNIIDSLPEFQKRQSAREAQLAILRKGVTHWNKWRRENPEIRPLLYDSDLTRESLLIDLNGADFSNAVLINSILSGQKLKEANFHEANLKGAVLHKAVLEDANFCRADLYETDLSEAILINANLQGTQLAKTNFAGAHLIACKVYGMSAWDLNLKDAEQKGLIIRYRYGSEGEQTESGNETEITVEDLQVAQFVYLLLSNKNVRSVIDTITSKVVLILGRFTEERKEILDAMRFALRQKDLIPIIFDFAIPMNRDVTETVKVLAGLAKFVLADVTDATEVRAELHNIVPEFPSLPIQPLVLAGREEFVSLSGHLSRFPGVLSTFKYRDQNHLLANLDDAIIKPAVVKQRELAGK